MSSSPAISPSEADLSRILASADRRTLAAVVIHLTGDVGAIKDLRDRGAIEALAMGVLPAPYAPLVRGQEP